MKICRRCKREKPPSDFNKNKSKKSGLASYCRNCCKIENEKYRIRYKTNPTKNNELKLYHQNWNKRNRLKRNRYLRNYRKNNPQLRKWHNRYYHEHKTDPHFRLLRAMRARIYYALKGKTKDQTTRNLVGCSIPALKTHLELQFSMGMTWKNYGDWHIDHIKPCASFDLSCPDEQKVCFHYTNLQPLWAKDNISKSDNIVHP